VKLKNWHVFAVISCILWLAYYPALSAPLNSIDDARLAHDLLNRTSFSWQDFWMPRSKSYFRPLVNSSFILDYLVWGFEESFLHLENILIHWLNTLLVYRLAKLVAGFQGLNTLAVPAFAATLFGLHPINSEAVIWVAGRADLLATTFVLLSLLGMLNYLRSGSILWLAGTVLAFFVGTLAKETAILVLPGLFALGWVAFRGKMPVAVSLVKAWLPAVGGLVALAGYAVLRSFALRGGDLGIRHVVSVATVSVPSGQPSPQLVSAYVSWLETARTVVKGAGYYAVKLVQPFPLNFGIIDVGDGYFWLGCLLLPLLVFLVARLSWWSSFVLTAMSLASVALLVAVGDISWTPYAERYMYAPSAMLALGVSLGGGRFAVRWEQLAWKPWLAGALGVLLLACAWAIFQRALVWQDNLTLFADTVKKSPGFALAHNQLAEALWQRGRKAEALDILRRVAMPESQVAYLNTALILQEDGKLAEARQFLLESLGRPETRAYHRVILERLINVVEQLRKIDSSPAQTLLYDEEILGYLQQLWRRTGDPFYLYRLGQKQMEKGDLALARESFALAYTKFPPESIYREPSRKLAERLKGQ
jgi:tetratricopeptide (TPR) repeat protein